MASIANQSRNIATHGIFTKSVTFHKGGPNLLAVSTTDNPQTWSSLEYSPHEELARLGKSIALNQAHRRNHEIWNIQQPHLWTSPRFIPTPHLIQVTEIKKSGFPSNPMVFKHASHSAPDSRYY